MRVLVQCSFPFGDATNGCGVLQLVQGMELGDCSRSSCQSNHRATTPYKHCNVCAYGGAGMDTPHSIGVMFGKWMSRKFPPSYVNANIFVGVTA